MSGYALTPLAKADIFDIWSYIANDSEDAADRLEQGIYDACAFVAEAPLRGQAGMPGPRRQQDCLRYYYSYDPISRFWKSRDHS